MPASISSRFEKKPPIIRFSATVRSLKTRRPSGEMAMPLRMMWCVSLWVMSSPSKVIVPCFARGLPQTVISSVVLPAPFAPISVTISPWLTSTDTPFSAWMAP
ncbi:hypothetical protein D9M71_777840 [compost metagenome]